MNSRLWSEVTTMDPTLCTYATDLGILYNIYDCFFEPVAGDYNNLQPCLVESYTVNDSATYYEFKIRENVKWHNGDILDVDDCVFSVERMRASSVTAARISAVTEVAKVDDTTFSITCAYPMPRLPALFSTASMSVVNKDLIEKYGDNAPETIVGTGAYKLESWETDKIVLTSFDEGWRGAPPLKTLNYLMIVDGNAARAAFDNGDVDAFFPDNMDVVGEYADMAQYRAVPYTTGTTDSLVFNVSRTDSWVSNATFRQAVAYCIDREVLCEIATDGMYRVVDSIFAPGNGAYDADWVYPYSYNPDKAKERLAQCGYDGAPVTFVYCSAYPIPTAWATTIENYMRQVGINVNMEGSDLAGAIDRFSRRDYDMACMEYAASYPDPLSSVCSMFYSDGYFNAWCYSSEALDVSIQSQIVNMLEDMQRDLGLTYLFIAHDISVVRHISTRIGVMYLGAVLELASSRELNRHPLHPYTRTLLSAVPVPDPDVCRSLKRIVLEGDVPTPFDPPPGCKFAARCPYASEKCRFCRPELREVAPEHYVACHMFNQS